LHGIPKRVQPGTPEAVLARHGHDIFDNALVDSVGWLRRGVKPWIFGRAQPGLAQRAEFFAFGGHGVDVIIGNTQKTI